MNELHDIAKMYLDAGFDKDLAYAKAWRDISASRQLIAHDIKTSKMPLAYDEKALHALRPDQMPRFLGAITHPELNEVKTFKFDELTAIQNRVDTAKVAGLAAKEITGPTGVAASFNGKTYILDGHHRTIAKWLSGADSVEMYHIDLNPVSNAMKSLEHEATLQTELKKFDEEKRLAYGWASVVEMNGQKVVDWHGDAIDVETIQRAAHDYMLTSRAAKVMHDGIVVGDIVESAVFTKDLQAAMSIDLNLVGWYICMKVYDAKTWRDIKAGDLKMFSIGGTAQRIVDNVA